MEFGIIKEKKRDGSYESHMLSKAVMTVGRSKSADIIIPDSSVSRIHVRIEQRGGAYYITDNNSSNGTYVNKKKITESVLRDGDELVVGRVLFFFSQKQESLQESFSGMKETVETPRVRMTETQSNPAHQSDPYGYETPQGASDAVPEEAYPNYEFDTPPTPPPPNAYGAPAPPAPPSFGAPPQNPKTPPPPAFGAPQAPSPPSFGAPQTPAPPSFGSAPVPPPPTFGASSAPAPPTFGGGSYSEFTAATPVQRLLAQLIDGLLIIPVMIVIIVLSWVSPTLGMVVGLLIMLGYPVYYFMALHKYGKTLGKHFLGLQIVEVDHPHKQGIEVKNVLMRWLGYAIYGWVTILFNPDGRGFHDKISNCMVIKK